MKGQSAAPYRDEAKDEALGAAFVDAAHGRNWTRRVILEHEAAAHEQIEVQHQRMLDSGHWPAFERRVRGPSQARFRARLLKDRRPLF